MTNKSFVEKSKIEKKLCINCKHCSVYAGLGKDRIMCGLYKDKVDDSELYYAWQSRDIPWRCGGRKWEIDPKIVVCESEEEADFLRSESFIESFMPLARKVVKGETKESPFSCGGYEEALKRAKQELFKSVVSNTLA